MLTKIDNAYGGFYLNVNEVLIIQTGSLGKATILFKNGEERTVNASLEELQESLIGEVENEN